MPDTRKSAMQPLFGHGIFNTDGHAWSHSRQLLRPAMKKNNIAPLMRMMERHFQIMLESIQVKSETGQGALDLQPLLFAFTMDTATEFLLGRSTHTLDPNRSSEREAAFVQDYVSCCVEAVRRMRLSPLRPLWMDRQVEAARKRAWSYVDSFVDDAIRVRESGKLPAANEDGDEDFSVEYNFLREVALDNGDRKFLRDQILNVLLAGRDTTAGLMSSFFFVLARRPDIYEKLRAEVATHFGGDLPTQETLKKATYLDWCLKEGEKYHFIPFVGILLISWSTSPAPVSHGPNQWPAGCQRHLASRGWRPGWTRPNVRQEGHDRSVLRLGPPPA